MLLVSSKQGNPEATDIVHYAYNKGKEIKKWKRVRGLEKNK